MILKQPASIFCFKKYAFLSLKTELRYCKNDETWYNRKTEKWFSNNFSGGVLVYLKTGVSQTFRAFFDVN